MSSEHKIENHPIKNSKIFENEILNKENIKIEIEEKKESNDNKKYQQPQNKNKKRKIKINKKIDVVNVESWKKYNAENTCEPNPNNSKDTTKCTCNIF